MNLQRSGVAAYATLDRDTENTMPEAVLFAQVAQRSRVDVDTVAAVMYGMADAVHDNWQRGRRTRIPGLGTIEPIWRGSRTVAINLPNRHRRRVRVGPQRSARLRPASRLRCYDLDSIGTPVEAQPGRPFFVVG